MSRRRHEYKTLWATIWEMAVFSIKWAAIITVIIGYAIVLYRKM